MKNTITEYTFVTDMTKEGYGFSIEGARALFEYLESYELDCETEMDYDPIAFRCGFTEYANLEEIKEVYDCIATLEDLHSRTKGFQFVGGIIIQDF